MAQFNRLSVTANPREKMIISQSKSQEKAAGTTAFSWLSVKRENAPGDYASPVELWYTMNEAYIRLNGHLAVINLKYEDDKFLEDYQDYYLKERWREKLTAESIELINARLNPDVVNYYQYEMIRQGQPPVYEDQE